MSEESKTALIENNSREELDQLARNEGIEDPEVFDTKEELAEAILANREEDATADDTEEGELVADKTDDEEDFERTFGHLEGEQLETAKAVWAAQKDHEAVLNERASGPYPSTKVEE